MAIYIVWLCAQSTIRFLPTRDTGTWTCYNKSIMCSLLGIRYSGECTYRRAVFTHMCAHDSRTVERKVHGTFLRVQIIQFKSTQRNIRPTYSYLDSHSHFKSSIYILLLLNYIFITCERLCHLLYIRQPEVTFDRIKRYFWVKLIKRMTFQVAVFNFELHVSN